MDKAKKDDLQARLKRIAGQVGGIQRMVEEERACIDVVMQVSAARAALAKVSRVLLLEHLASSVAAIIDQDPRDRRRMMDELLRVLERCDT
jgi:CsoR family transcriptional regulator, copper-sensing transcriptional repressor